MSISDHAILVLDGRHYRWSGWFGCQLESMEWRRRPAGTEREIAGRKFRVFSTVRAGIRYRTTWALAICGSVDYCNEQIRALKSALRELV